MGLNLAGQTVEIEFDLFYLGQDDKGADEKAKELRSLTPDFTFNQATNPKKEPYTITFAPGNRRLGKSSSRSIRTSSPSTRPAQS